MLNSKYIYISLFLLFAISANFLFASEEDLDQLTAEQKVLQADIEHSLVAPCCWNMTLDQHDSPKAAKARDEITKLIKEGKTKAQILDYFVAQPQYGERILAAPSQKTWLGKSAYWLIPIAILLGAVAVGVTIKSLTKPGAKQEKNVSKKTAEKVTENKSDPWSNRVEEELKKYDN